MMPVLQALVIAERIYTDDVGRKIICGTFNEIRLSDSSVAQQVEGPDGTKLHTLQGGADVGSPSAFLSLTDVVDGTELKLQMVNLTKNEVMFHVGVKIEKAHRLATVEMVLPLPATSIFATEPGTLSLEVVWKGEILGSARITVVKQNP